MSSRSDELLTCYIILCNFFNARSLTSLGHMSGITVMSNFLKVKTTSGEEQKSDEYSLVRCFTNYLMPACLTSHSSSSSSSTSSG